ncbi:T9SS type A sorting domain-containing protein [Hymenobacter coalescens]
MSFVDSTSFRQRLKRVFVPVATGIASCLASAGAAQAQAPDWQSVLNTTQTVGNSSTVTATAVNAAGDVFLAGTIRGSVSFGSTVVSSTGGTEAFVAKWTPGLGFRWVQPLGVSTVAHVVVNGSSVLLAGAYSAASVRLGTSVLTSAGGTDGYLARLTDAGSSASFDWARSLGGSADDKIYALAASGSSVYIAGDFYSPALAVGNTTLTNAGTGTNDAFVAKFTDAGSAGTPEWALRVGSAERDVATALAVSGTSVYLAGSFYGSSIALGSTSLPNTPSALGGSDAFVAKLTDGGSSGTFTWAQHIGGEVFEEVWVLGVSGSSVYATGRFNSLTAALGSTILANASGSFDTFVAKLTDGGNTGAFTWAYRAGGTGHDAGWGVAVRGNSLYVAGAFYSATATFGSTTLTNASSLDTYDLFVTKLVDAGSSASFSWAQRAGGTQDDEARSLALGANRLYIGGYVQPEASFGSMTLLAPVGERVAYVAWLNDAALATTAPAWAVGLQLYPNPARSAVTVQLPAVPGASQATLTLTDALGRTVLTQAAPMTAAGSRTELPLPGLSAGLYHVRVQAGGQQASRALVIE